MKLFNVAVIPGCLDYVNYYVCNQCNTTYFSYNYSCVPYCPVNTTIYSTKTSQSCMNCSANCSYCNESNVDNRCTSCKPATPYFEINNINDTTGKCLSYCDIGYTVLNGTKTCIPVIYTDPFVLSAKNLGSIVQQVINYLK